MNGAVWTDEMVDKLKECWASGLSTRVIADMIEGTTRNSIIGKANRLGLERRKEAPKCEVERKPRVAVARLAKVENLPAQEAIIVAFPLAEKISVYDLTREMCRWPLGDPSDAEFRFCGARIHSGPYCAGHVSLAYKR